MTQSRPSWKTPTQPRPSRTKTTQPRAFREKMADLDNRIQALPQELQDEIFAQYLQLATTAEVVKVTWAYRPPTQLAINQKSRASLARMYYGERRFLFKLFPTKRPRKWLRSLGPGQRSMLSDVLVEHVKGTYQGQAHSEEHEKIGFWFVMDNMGEKGMRLKKGVLRFECRPRVLV